MTITDARAAYAAADKALTAAREALAAYEGQPDYVYDDGDTIGTKLFEAETAAYEAWLEAEDALWVVERNNLAYPMTELTDDEVMRLQEEVRSR